MVSRDTCFLTLVLVSGFLVVSMDARSWDIAVAIDKRVDFFAQNGTIVRQANVTGAGMLVGLAYDNVTKTIYMSDGQQKDAAMYSGSLTETKSDSKIVLERANNTSIIAIAFDPVDRSLFWIEGRLEKLMKMDVPLKGELGYPEELHDLANHSPFAIALDICNRFIYWSSQKENGNGTIERSRLDGSDRRVIVSDFHRVNGLAIDQSEGKLYWVDNFDSNEFKIESSNLDGSDRALFFSTQGHNTVHIAVDTEFVYWTDWTADTIWKMRKNKGTNEQPEEFVLYKAFTPDHNIMNIITRDNSGNIDCNAVRNRSHDTPNAVEPRHESIDDSTSAAEDTNSAGRRDEKCSNGGLWNETAASCTCKEGFFGIVCEISPCHNYCVNGNCALDEKNSPKCDCGTSYTGDRCEKDICDGYCMNNGTCSISSTGPICKCDNSLGSRCEYTNELEKICSLYCRENEDALNSFSLGLALCKCSQLNETLPEQLTAAEGLVPSTIILSSLAALIVTLIIVVGILSYHVNKLKHRPRIRKRFVVSKGGVTPLTSRPQIPADSCEITIENCCNMNICETPCFEPKLRATPTKSSGTKKEEKNSLLDSMEGADSC